MKAVFVDFFKTVGISLCAYLLIWWVGFSDFVNEAWSGAVFYFGVTLWLLEKYCKDGALSLGQSVTGVIIGRILIDFLVRLSDWTSSYPSLIITISSVISIILAAMYFKNKSVEVIVLSIALMILFNSFVIEAWFDYIDGMRGLPTF